MQVFIIGSAIETAMCLDKKRLNKQIIECRQILKAIYGESKAWTNHPCTIQYKKHKEWLIAYMHCLEAFYNKDIHKARIWNLYASDNTPDFHTSAYFDNMKKRIQAIFEVTLIFPKFLIGVRLNSVAIISNCAKNVNSKTLKRV